MKAKGESGGDLWVHFGSHGMELFALGTRAATNAEASTGASGTEAETTRLPERTTPDPRPLSFLP